MGSMRYNEDREDISKLKPFDYSTEYTANPNADEEVGIFDVAREHKDLWQEGEEEKNAYRKVFEKQVQSYFKRKQNTLSQDIITKLLLMGAGTFVLTFFVLGKIFLTLKGISRGFKVDNSFGIFSVPYQLLSGSIPLLFFVVLLSALLGYYVVFKYVQSISRFDNRKEAKGSKPAYLNYDQNKCREVFEIREQDEPVGVPIAVYRGMVYCMPDNPNHKQFRNKNLMYIGGSGSGKSYAGVEPLILQRIANKESFIVSDTKGALYKDLAACCETMGFDVWMFSTKGFTRSDSWNCLFDIIHAADDVAWDKIDDFAHTLIKNSKRNGEKGDQYWDNNEQDLLRALLHYVCRSKMFDMDGGRTFANLIDLINGSVEDIDQIFKSLPSNESAYDASASFRNLNNIDLKEKYRSGLANKLHMFKNPYVKAAMSYDGISIESSVHRPTAIFLVSADDKETFDAVTSLFITNAYMKLIEIADSDNYNDGALYKPYWLILDEMCNMAAINDMSRKISTNRSRNINFALTIQSISQIEERYGKLFENIAANCGCIIPVGVFDDTTAKFVANKCGTFSEVTTADMTKKPTFFSKYAIPFQKTERVQISEAKVLTEFNIKNSLDGDILALIAGKELFRGKPYGTDKHPLYKYCKPVGIDEREPEWFQQFKRENPDMNFESGSMYTPSDYELGKTEVSYEPEAQAKPKKEAKPARTEKPKSEQRTNFSKLLGENFFEKEEETGELPFREDNFNESTKGISEELTAAQNIIENENSNNLHEAVKPTGKEISSSGNKEEPKPRRKFEAQPIQSANPPAQIQDEQSINTAVPRKESTNLEGLSAYYSPDTTQKDTKAFYDEISASTYGDNDFSDLENLLADEDM